MHRTKIPVVQMEIDHICYRVSSKREYQEVLKALLNLGDNLVEGMINGRPISTVKLNSPLIYKDWKISCVELPCPKPGRYYSTGLEHIEVVIGDEDSSPYDSQEALLKFVKQYENREEGIIFNTQESIKKCNGDVSLRVDEESIVKFHLCALPRVIEVEKEEGLVEPPPEGYFDQPE